MTDDERLGQPVPGWRVPPRPAFIALEGRYARVELLEPAHHAAELHRANSGDAAGAIWDFLPYGPFEGEAAYADWLAEVAGREDPRFHAIRDLESGQATGVASYLRVNPGAGSIEVGHINLSQALQGTRAATEAMYLMMRWAFEAGYRRYEWKCNALNAASRRAAERLGLSHEGVFRQMQVVKGRSRDTAWFAAIDAEWPALETAFETWLDPSNFDAEGRQIGRLSDLTHPLLVTRDPALAPPG